MRKATLPAINYHHSTNLLTIGLRCLPKRTASFTLRRYLDDASFVCLSHISTKPGECPPPYTGSVAGEWLLFTFVIDLFMCTFHLVWSLLRAGAAVGTLLGKKRRRECSTRFMQFSSAERSDRSDPAAVTGPDLCAATDRNRRLEFFDCFRVGCHRLVNICPLHVRRVSDEALIPSLIGESYAELCPVSRALINF